MPPLFSIITPSYNAKEKLKATLESVRTQPAELFEYWIIDGGSRDGTADWLRENEFEGLHWISERDQGVYDAMNKGILRSQGHFIYFLGAGDLLRPGVLAEAQSCISNLPDTPLRFVYGNVRFMRDGGRVGDGRFDKRKMCDLNVCHQAIFYDRKIYDLLGLYDLKYRIFSDWIYNLRCFADRRIACHYWDKAIADYEGGGLSDHAVDESFNQDRLGLIARWLGWQYAAGYWYRSFLKPVLKRLLGRTA